MCGHKFNINNIKLLKSITNKRKLVAYESILLFKNRKKKLMNDEQQIAGNIKSPLFKFWDNHQSSHYFFFEKLFFQSLQAVVFYGLKK
jgi:hypothetical protein